MPNSRPAPGAGRARAWNATTLCAPASWAASNAAGRPNRSPAGSAGKRPPPPSATKASTASSTPRSGAPRTAPGAATCPEPSSNAGGAAAEAAPPPASSRTGSPLTNDLPTSDTGVARDIGRPISCSSPPTVRPSSSPRNASPASSCLPSNPAKQLSRPSNNSSPGSSPSTASSAKPSRSTTEPSSLSTTNSPASSASGPSSAIPTAPGKKAASKTPSAACEDPCRARQTSRPSTATPSTPASPPTTTHPVSASDTNHPLRPSLLNCCTSNVNPPSRFRGNDIERLLGKKLRTLALFLALTLILPTAPAVAQSLNDALADAYQTSPVLQAARAQLRATDELVPEALSGWRPTVNAEAAAGAGIDNNHNDGRLLGLAELRITQPIYTGGRTGAAVNQAEKLVQAQRAQLVAAEQQVLLQSVTAYMDVVRAAAVLTLNENNEKVVRDQRDSARRRRSAGAASDTDVSQAESRLALAGAQRTQADAALKSARATYRQLIGADPATLTPPALPTSLPASEGEAVAAAAGHPAVVAAEFAERAARDGVDVVLGEMRPQVSVEGDLMTNKETARILARVTIPFYQAGGVDARARSSKETYGERRFDTETEQRQTAAEAAAA